MANNIEYKWEQYKTKIADNNGVMQDYTAYIYKDGKFVKYRPMILRLIGQTSNIVNIAIVDKTVVG